MKLILNWARLAWVPYPHRASIRRDDAKFCFCAKSDPSKTCPDTTPQAGGRDFDCAAVSPARHFHHHGITGVVDQVIAHGPLIRPHPLPVVLDSGSTLVRTPSCGFVDTHLLQTVQWLVWDILNGRGLASTGARHISSVGQGYFKLLDSRIELGNLSI
jgi:hypothetical protein